MFLHTGEGIVSKGSVGPWASEEPGEYHLGRESASDISHRCVETYTSCHGPPSELFIHGRTRFNRDEIEGFRNAAPHGTAITGIRWPCSAQRAAKLPFI